MKKTCGKAAFYAAIIVICLIMVTPVYLLAKVSFSVKSEILTQDRKSTRLNSSH